MPAEAPHEAGSIHAHRGSSGVANDPSFDAISAAGASLQLMTNHSGTNHSGTNHSGVDDSGVDDSGRDNRPPSAAVLSVNLGAAMDAGFTSAARTAIDKRSVDHPVMVTAPGPKGIAGSGLAGDDVCDRRHHGGNDQAVYAYAREDLDTWQAELGRTLAAGSFGENLTTEGVDITNAVVGEQWAIGDTLVLEVSDPRIPCRTFAGFLAQRGWMKRFTQRAAPGTYLRVLTPGPVSAGNGIRIIHRPDHGVTVATAFRAFTTEPELLARLVGVEGLSPEAKSAVTKRSRIALDADLA